MQFSAEVPSTTAAAYLLSPRVTINSQRCLTFLFFNRAGLKLSLAYSNNLMRSVMTATINGGLAWHSAYINIPRGTYFLYWESSGNSDETPDGGNPEDVYLAAIDDVKLHNSRCSEEIGTVFLFFFK